MNEPHKPKLTDYLTEALGGGQPLPGDLRSWNSEKERMQLRRQQLRDAAWIHI